MMLHCNLLAKVLRLTRRCVFRRQPLWTMASVVTTSCCMFTVFLLIVWSAGMFGSFLPFSSRPKDRSGAAFDAQFSGHAPSAEFKAGRPRKAYQCPNGDGNIPYTPMTTSSSLAYSLNNIQKFKLTPRSKILLLLQSSPYSLLANELVVTLEWARLPYRAELIKHSLPYLTRSDLGKYALVIFENASSYFSMDLWNRQLLHTYSRQYGVGIAAFISDLPSGSSSPFRFKQLPDSDDFIEIEACTSPPAAVVLTNNSDLLRISKPGLVWRFDGANNQMKFSAETWHKISFSNESAFRVLASGLWHNQLQPVVIEDIGLVDGVRRIFFGHPRLSLWLNRVLFLDSLSLLLSSNSSPATPVLPLERYLLIDIDDVFVGTGGKRMMSNDIEELVAFQRRMQEKISPTFKLNLGYSGGYYLRGNELEDEADRLFISKAGYFNWFHHNWLHRKPHLMTYDKLVEDISLNIDFARQHSLPLDRSYSIAPFHSGVYPVHEPLFAAWHDVLGVAATATEHFPHSRPLWKRRGFVHWPSGIKVLPRQQMALFTHTNYFDEFQGGKDALDAMIQGGQIFNTLLFNPVAAYMTHQSNYALDRLAPYTIESLVNFVQCHTRLQIRYLPPSHLASVYFALYPNDTDAIWTNPCDDHNHLTIWSPAKSCSGLPDLLIVGPQKTGSTALAHFLAMHPKTITNKPTKRSFEETQFFSDRRVYLRGLDWYISLFEASPSVLPGNRSQFTVFEKSATYFDNDAAITRIKALLPRANIVILIEDPAKRAYSWYQHQRARGNSWAMNTTFYHVLTQGSDVAKLRSLRNRCLHPGQYAQQIDKWLMHYSSRKLHFVDSDQLADDPVSVLNELQKFLQLEPTFDYASRLRFDRMKGFFCEVDAVDTDKVHCLGKSKGRKYEPMDGESRRYLDDYFRPHNLRLLTLLRHLGYRIPTWLLQQFAVSPNQHDQKTYA